MVTRSVSFYLTAFRKRNQNDLTAVTVVYEHIIFIIIRAQCRKTRDDDDFENALAYNTRTCIYIYV